MAWKAKLVRVGDPSLSQSAEVDIEFTDDTDGRRFVQSFKVAPGQFANAQAFTRFVQGQTAVLVAQDQALADLRALIGLEL